jgi:AAA ATPase domain
VDVRIEKLSVAERASWDPARACLTNTRVALLEEIWQWIKSPNINAMDNIQNPSGADDTTCRIFLLTGTAGGGKSTIAHTVAHRCDEEHVLISSFFFDRNFTKRPKSLFSTIARDLARHDSEFRRQISQAIELDERLLMAPVTRQFNDLILMPSRKHSVDGPLVIIIDALDECDDEDVLDIICDQVPKLPASFRIFLTSREGHDCSSVLSRRDHVCSQFINITEQANLEDISLFIDFQLRKLAEKKNLGVHWPGDRLLKLFTKKAEGLFLWVAIVYRYLIGSIDPDEELRSLVLNSTPTDVPAEEKMDALYLTILQSCKWRDKAFSKGYSLLMGAIMAVKVPLSSSALQTLHGTSLKLPVNQYLQPIACLLTGLAQVDQLIQPLHSSFRDFITIRAQTHVDTKQFYIDEKEHSKRLALQCLLLMNKNLEQIGGSLGYLNSKCQSKGVPPITEDLICEGMWYSCQHWIDHICDADDLNMDLREELHTFLSHHLISWIEITTSKGKFRGLQEVRKWIEVSISTMCIPRLFIIVMVSWL